VVRGCLRSDGVPQAVRRQQDARARVRQRHLRQSEHVRNL
jgi:hypothetical protein